MGKDIDEATLERWKKELLADFVNMPKASVRSISVRDAEAHPEWGVWFVIEMPSPKMPTVSTTIAQFTIKPFPDCSLFMLSTGSYVGPDHRRKGIATLLYKHKRRIARDMGAEQLMATVRNSNVAEIACLKKNNWKKIGGTEGVGVWVTTTLDKFYL